MTRTSSDLLIRFDFPPLTAGDPAAFDGEELFFVVVVSIFFAGAAFAETSAFFDTIFFVATFHLFWASA